MTKARTDFSNYTASALLPAARKIHTDMVAAAITFPELPTKMAPLLVLIDD